MPAGQNVDLRSQGNLVSAKLYAIPARFSKYFQSSRKRCYSVSQVLNNFAPDTRPRLVEGKGFSFFFFFYDSTIRSFHGPTVTVSPVDNIHHPSTILRTLRIVKRPLSLYFSHLKRTFLLLSSGLIKPCRHLFAPTGLSKEKEKKNSSHSEGHVIHTQYPFSEEVHSSPRETRIPASCTTYSNETHNRESQS